MKNVNTFVEEIISLDNFEGIEDKYDSYVQAARSGAVTMLSKAKEVCQDIYGKDIYDSAYEPFYDALIDAMVTAPWKDEKAIDEFYGDFWDRVKPYSGDVGGYSYEYLRERFTEMGVKFFVSLRSAFCEDTPGSIDRQPWDKTHYVGECALGFIDGASSIATFLAFGKGDVLEAEEDDKISNFFAAVCDELFLVSLPLQWTITAQREATEAQHEAADAESKK